ncbi:MAG: formylglycine-generating enzyme family protein [Anaerolineales bacterium]
MKRRLALLTLLFSACTSAGNPNSTPVADAPTLEAIAPTSDEELASEMPTDEPVTLESGTVRIAESDGMEMIYIEAGEFTMGSEDDDAKQTPTGVGGVAWPEGPEHLVWVNSFWIDKYEVTNAQYALCVNKGACDPPRMLDGAQALLAVEPFIGRDYYTNPEYADYPVVYVDFYAARDYCAWAGRRMPTEAEWEKAARGTDGRRYAWGDDPVANEKANFCDGNCPKEVANPSYDDGYMVTAPVGSYPAGASPFGALDMAGNVWEWVDTIPMFYPYDPNDGREEPDTRIGSCYPPAPCAEGETPFGDGPERVIRGGTWQNGPWWLRATVRYKLVPGYAHWSTGFRCAADAE